MARLASESKMGFYPTSVTSIQKVIDLTLELQKGTHVLDCCAGEGEAIEKIGATYSCNTYAVELDENRAKIANDRAIDIVLNADALYGVRKSNRWVGLNFLNPPYDQNASGGRLEIDFVEKWGLTTAIGGVMILVINPSSADEEMAEKLRKQGYKPMFSFYDPDNEDYKKFGQFFIVLQQHMMHFRAALSSFLEAFKSPKNINEVNSETITKLVVKPGAKPKMFKEIEVPRWKIEVQLQKSKLKDLFFNDLKVAGLQKKSIESPNEGQAALLIASGALNKEITLANKDRVILKGSSKKIQTEFEKTNELGEVTSVKVVDSYKTVIYGLNLTNGKFVKYE